MQKIDKAGKREHRARVMLCISMIIFGTLGLFTRNIPVSSGELALYRAILAAILIGVFLTIGRRWSGLRAAKKELPLLFASGAAMGINWILLFQAYRYTTVSIATLSYYFAPVIVTLTCPILFRERLTKKQWVCFIMSTLGLILIIGVGSPSGGRSDLTGILFGLGAACFYAAVILLNKFIRQVGGIQRTFLQFLAAIIVLIPYVVCTGGSSLGKLNTVAWISLLAVGLIHTGITYCMYFTALKELKGQETAILSYLDPLVAVLVSVVVLHEKLTLLQAIGGILILGFTLWNELGTEET